VFTYSNDSKILAEVRTNNQKSKYSKNKYSQNSIHICYAYDGEKDDTENHKFTIKKNPKKCFIFSTNCLPNLMILFLV